MNLHRRIVGEIPTVYRGPAAGLIVGSLITTAGTYYAGKKANEAQDSANAAQARAMSEAEARQATALSEAEARQAQLDKDNATRANEANQAVGESATLDFTTEQSTSSGSSLDFLVPKVGSSQLGGSTTSGLGV